MAINKMGSEEAELPEWQTGDETSELLGTSNVESESAHATTFDRSASGAGISEVTDSTLRWLFRDGEILKFDASLDVPPQADIASLARLSGEQAITEADRPDTDAVLIEFEKSSDGRGFSLAAQIRQSNQYRGLIVAYGINPDQVSAAFQVGFDCVQVDASQWQQYSEADWVGSLRPSVSVSYLSNRHSHLTPVWQSRSSRD